MAQLAGDDARAGAWGRAVEAYRLASVRGPLPYWCWHPAALAHLKGGDHQGYRQICLAAVAEAPGTALTNVVNLAAWTCVLAPNAVDDYRPVLALAEQAVKTARPNSRHNVLNTLGAVLFRAGHCKEAIQRLNEGIEANGGKGGAHDWIFLALAHCQLGETAEAQKYLKLAMNAGPHPDLWGSVELELLCAEGKSHVQVNTPANKRSHSSD